MLSYQNEIIARARMEERLQEAARERRARRPSPRTQDGRTWRARLTMAIVSRLIRAAHAS